MSPRTTDPHRCRLSFADGRRCRQPAHLDFDGLCFTHGTLASRASRQDNFLRELAPFTSAAPTETDYQRAARTLFRAVDARRISSNRAAVLLQVANLLRQSQRASQVESFHAHCGPAWHRLRHLLDASFSSES